MSELMLEPRLLPGALRALADPDRQPGGGMEALIDLDEGCFVVLVPADDGSGSPFHHRLACRMVVDHTEIERLRSDVSLRVTGSIVGLIWVAMGEMTAAKALADGMLDISGPDDERRFFCELYGIETAAVVKR